MCRTLFQILRTQQKTKVTKSCLMTLSFQCGEGHSSELLEDIECYGETKPTSREEKGGVEMQGRGIRVFIRFKVCFFFDGRTAHSDR